MEIKAFLVMLSEIEAKLQGEVIWTHAHNSARICVLFKSTAHRKIVVKLTEFPKLGTTEVI